MLTCDQALSLSLLSFLFLSLSPEKKKPPNRRLIPCACRVSENKNITIDCAFGLFDVTNVVVRVATKLELVVNYNTGNYPLGFLHFSRKIGLFAKTKI